MESLKYVKDNELIISDEDFASIANAQCLRKETVLITDILQTKFLEGNLSIIEKKLNSNLRKILEKCDCIIIPDDGKDHDNIKYVGKIVREITEPRANLRKKFNFTTYTIVLSIGACYYGEYLLYRVLESFVSLNDKYDIQLIIVTGNPKLLLNCKGKNIQYKYMLSNLHEYIYASDLIISFAGKSTIDESIVYGTPGIFIPIKNHFEQEKNAKEQGYIYDDIFRINELILNKINGINNRIVKPFDGAKKAVDIIQQYITN